MKRRRKGRKKKGYIALSANVRNVASALMTFLKRKVRIYPSPGFHPRMQFLRILADPARGSTTGELFNFARFHYNFKSPGYFDTHSPLVFCFRSRELLAIVGLQLVPVTGGWTKGNCLGNRNWDRVSLLQRPLPPKTALLFLLFIPCSISFAFSNLDCFEHFSGNVCVSFYMKFLQFCESLRQTTRNLKRSNRNKCSDRSARYADTFRQPTVFFFVLAHNLQLRKKNRERIGTASHLSALLFCLMEKNTFKSRSFPRFRFQVSRSFQLCFSSRSYARFAITRL